eukprot:symbB.v1.2.004744.t1/scaffold275.1/size244369/14
MPHSSLQGIVLRLRIFLWDWKRAVTSSTSIKILRLWYVVAAMEIFKCKRWLLEFCLRLWAALVRIPLMRKAQAQLQPILVLHEEASIESRIIAGESFLLQYVVICTWRRFLRAELLKLEVKQVCREWNSEELRYHQVLRLVSEEKVYLFPLCKGGTGCPNSGSCPTANQQNLGMGRSLHAKIPSTGGLA